jgi:hypothetical protein
MTTTLLLFGLLALCAQEDPAALIQKLRSEKIEEREQASQELKKLGMPALAELEKLAADKDIEVATRARTLIRTIRLKEILGVELKDLGNLSALQVVEWMEKKTNRKFLLSENLGLRNLRLRIPEEFLDLNDPYAVGVDLLKVASIGVTPSETNPGAIEVFPGPIGGKQAIKVYQKVEDLPRANEFCTLVLHPRHVSPRDVQALLINVISFPQNVLSVEEGGTLLLSDYSSILRKCAAIVKEVDFSRSFRVSVALLEARSGKDASVPEGFRNLQLADATGANQFTVLGTASAKLERVVQVAPWRGGTRKILLRLPGNPAYLVEFDGSIRPEGGPILEGLSVSLDQEKPKRLFEARLTLKDGQWAVAGTIPAAEGASIVILARAVPE